MAKLFESMAVFLDRDYPPSRMPSPPLQIVVPPAICEPDAPVMPTFVGSQDRYDGLAEAYSDVARVHGCSVFAAVR